MPRQRQESTAIEEVTGPPRRGRRRDPTRDADILDAALTVLAEAGYDGMTMDLVAERAHAGKATVYRRWTSKDELVLEAVTRMAHGDVDPGLLADTGTLRQDLMSLLATDALADSGRRLRVMGALSALLGSARAPLAEAAHAAGVAPWIDANRVLLLRAVERGEIAADTDVELLATVVPSMATCRVSLERKEITREFIVAVYEQVLLPAVGLGPAAP